MAEKIKRGYYLDWWKIKKSTIYGLVGLGIFLSASAGGLWYASRNNWFLEEGPNLEKPKDAAILLNFEGDVRIVRASTRETIKVTTQTYLVAGDTIQTQADGKATVKMIDGSTLSIKPNSTVVIRNSTSIFGGTDVRVALDDGQINVKTEDQTEASQNVVEVKEVPNRMLPQTEASFNINQNTNGGEIRIMRGGVETNAEGQKTLIKDGEYASISNGKLSPRERLLEPPKLIAPAALDQLLAGSRGTTDVTFRWQKFEAGTSFNYQFSLASSPFFVKEGMVFEREGIGTPNISLANLAPGNYYWRVRALASSGQTSEWSEPWKFIILKRESGSLAASDFQVENFGGNVYIISGKTVPGATVRILGRETFAGADGSFKLQTSVPSSEVTVDIGDEHGNRTSYVISLKDARVLRHS